MKFGSCCTRKGQRIYTRGLKTFVLSLGFCASVMGRLDPFSINGSSPSAWAQPASSASLPRVYLLPVVASAPDVSPLIPRRLNQQFLVELKAQQEIELLAQIQASQKPTKARPKASTPSKPGIKFAKKAVDRRKEASTLAGEARTAFKNKQYKKVIELCLKSIDAFDASMVYLAHTDDLAKVFALLGQALLLTGKRAQGITAVETAASYDPALKIDFKTMPSKIRSTFFSAVKRHLKRSKAAVEVDGKPPGATIFLDGDEKGIGKVRVKNVVPGRHYVVVRLKDHVPQGRVIRVEPGGEKKLSFVLQPELQVTGSGALAGLFEKELLKRLGDQMVDVRVKPLAKQLARRVNADFVLLSAVERTTEGGYLMRTYLFRAKDLRLVELPAGSYDAELLNLNKGIYRTVQAILAAVARFPVDKDITKVSLRTHGRRVVKEGPEDLVHVAGKDRKSKALDVKIPIYKKWWFWTIIGGVVAVGAAVAGGYLGYSATHAKSTGYKVTLELP